MNSRLPSVLAGLLLTICAPVLWAQEKQSAVAVYDVNIAISKDGVLLARPYFLVESGRLARITLNTEQEGPLEISFSAEDYIADGAVRPNAVAFAAEISTVREGLATVLAAPSAAIFYNQPATISTNGLDISVEVRMGNSSLAGKTLDCNPDSSIAKSSAQSSCCSAACVDGRTMTCCNVISCCDPICGACCSPVEP